MTIEQKRRVKVLKELSLRLSDAKTEREKDFYFATLVMKMHYKRDQETKYVIGGKEKFFNSLDWYFRIYKDEIQRHTDYVYDDDKREITITVISSSEVINATDIEDAQRITNCSKRSIIECLSGERDCCRGFTFVYK